MNSLNSRAAAIAVVAIMATTVAGCGINAIPTKEETAKAR